MEFSYILFSYIGSELHVVMSLRSRFDYIFLGLAYAAVEDILFVSLLRGVSLSCLLSFFFHMTKLMPNCLNLYLSLLVKVLGITCQPPGIEKLSYAHGCKIQITSWKLNVINKIKNFQSLEEHALSN